MKNVEFNLKLVSRNLLLLLCEKTHVRKSKTCPQIRNDFTKKAYVLYKLSIPKHFFIFSFFAKGTQTNCHVAIDIYSKARIALVRRIEEW